MSSRRKIFTITELMSDERFQNYCLKRNKVDEDYWKLKILHNWDQRHVFEEAYSAIQALSNENLYSLERKESKVIDLIKPKTKTFSFDWLLKSAVAVIILLLIVFNLPDNSKYIKVTSSYGETKRVTLPDSSLIVLNSNSMLVYEESMRSSREVQLVGEAYFDVKTKPDLTPFIVKTQHGLIQVTGTIFNVRSRSDLFESTLIEGGITFKREGKNDVILTPGNHLNISDNSLKMTSGGGNNLFAWKEGRLFFKEASILEVAKRLRDDYGLTVIVKNDSLKLKMINANVKTSNPMVLLESIAAIYDFSISKVSDDKVILK